jgi:hypothetical protein
MNDMQGILRFKHAYAHACVLNTQPCTPVRYDYLRVVAQHVVLTLLLLRSRICVVVCVVAFDYYRTTVLHCVVLIWA